MWVLIEDFVTNSCERLDDEFENILFFTSVAFLSTSRCNLGVGLSQGLDEKLGEIAEVHHVFANNLYEFARPVDEFCEYVIHKFVCNKVESISEILNDMIKALLEVFVFWIILTHLIGKG